MKTLPHMTSTILVLNAGSSSLKYKLFQGETELLAGMIDSIGHNGTSSVRTNEITRSSARSTPNHDDAIAAALATVQEIFPHEQIDYVAHRVVHGGENFTHHTVINKDIEEGIQELAKLAPLHNPANLAGIKAARAALPDATHIACFDTAFHHTIPKFAFLYGLPYALYTDYGIRKYGFHGLSHEYCAQRAYEITHHSDRIITCHLGAGSSICAVHNGRSHDTTMGFTPLDGLLMATRAGELDPDIPLYLMETHNLTSQQVRNLLNNESGLKGLTGSGDLREVKRRSDAGESMAQTAIEMMCYRIALNIGSYHITLGGVRAITFTGGIGENASFIRSRVCSLLAPLGVVIDDAANARGHDKISTSHSAVSVHVIPANEELHMARIVLAGRFTNYS